MPGEAEYVTCYRRHLVFLHNIVLSFNSSFQLSAAQRPKRLSLTVEDPKGEEVEVHIKQLSAVDPFRKWLFVSKFCSMYLNQHH